MPKILTYFILALALAGCSKGFDSSNQSADQSLNLQSAKAKWASNKSNLDSYHLTLGYSGAVGYTKIISLVDDSAVAACAESYKSWQDNNTSDSACSLDRGDTVETLFAKIEAGISSGQLAIAEYDPDFGVPTQIYIKGPETDMADAISGYSTVVQFAFPIP